MSPRVNLDSRRTKMRGRGRDSKRPRARGEKLSSRARLSSAPKKENYVSETSAVLRRRLLETRSSRGGDFLEAQNVLDPHVTGDLFPSVIFARDNRENPRRIGIPSKTRDAAPDGFRWRTVREEKKKKSRVAFVK